MSPNDKLPDNGDLQNDISRLKILVAEDSQMNILLMKKLLAKWQVEADFAPDGLSAVDFFKNTAYDLILMDLYMPVMDGYEATRLIRNEEDKTKERVHIIALTASIAADDRAKIGEAGMDDFISKPFDPVALRTKLEDVASRKA